MKCCWLATEHAPLYPVFCGKMSGERVFGCPLFIHSLTETFRTIFLSCFCLPLSLQAHTDYITFQRNHPQMWQARMEQANTVGRAYHATWRREVSLKVFTHLLCLELPSGGPKFKCFIIVTNCAKVHCVAINYEAYLNYKSN